MKKHIKIETIVFVIITFLILSCSPVFKSNVLTFFFDGVPPYDSAKVIATEGQVLDTLDSDIFRIDPVESLAEFIVHYPYQEKECYSCHDENYKSELVMPEPDLCYMCHTDFSTMYKYVHGPVSSGFCTECHNAHMSKEQKLLTRTGQQICLYCHDASLLFTSDTHKDIDNTECTLCHNPHGGDDKYIFN